MSSLKQRSIDAVIWNLIERYGSQIVGLFIGIILARLLSPADYGLIGMITVFFAIAMVFVNSGFGAAYIQKKDANEIDASTIFFFNLMVSFFLYFVLWFTAPLIANFYDEEQLTNLIRVTGIILIINSFSMMQITKLKKDVNFKKKAIISLVSTVLSGTVGIFAALNGYGVWSLVFQKISSAIIIAIGLWFFYKWRPLWVFNINSLQTMFAFSSWVLLSNIIRTVFDNIYILTIGKFFPVAQLGFYTKAKGYQKMVSMQPSSAIAAVSFPVFSKLQDDKYALKNSMRKFLQHTLFIIAQVEVILIVIAKPLFLIVLTNKWLPMVPYFQLLLLIGFLFPLQLFNVKLLTAQGKTKLNFNLSILKNILKLLNIVIMYRFGVIYLIYGQIIISFIGLFINGYYTKIFINYGIFEQLKDLSKTFIISVITIMVGFLVIDLITNNYSKIMFGILFCGGSYNLMLYIMDRNFYLSNMEMLKSKIKKNRSI